MGRTSKLSAHKLKGQPRKCEENMRATNPPCIPPPQIIFTSKNFKTVASMTNQHSVRVETFKCIQGTMPPDRFGRSTLFFFFVMHLFALRTSVNIEGAAGLSGKAWPLPACDTNVTVSHVLNISGVAWLDRNPFLTKNKQTNKQNIQAHGLMSPR